MNSFSGELTQNTIWEGDILLEGDVLVPENITLRVLEGTRIISSKLPKWSCAVFRAAPEGYPIEATYREYCDLLVLGNMEAEGTERHPVQFGNLSHSWGGITFLKGANARLKYAHLRNTQEFALQSFDNSKINLENCDLLDSEVGIWSWGMSKVIFKNGRINVSRCGIRCCEGSFVKLQNTVIQGAEQSYSAELWTILKVA